MAVMIFGDPPGLDSIVETLVGLEREIGTL
jgi:hypothetical protein